MRSERIPLFLLEVVLFPGTPLPLHIFEPRYKLMIRRCLENRGEFGVVLAEGKRMAPIGCTAEIIKTVKEYEDGRMDILTLGQAAYRIRGVFEDEPYLEGSVEYLAEEAGETASEMPARLWTVFEQCYALVYARGPKSLERNAAASFAFHLASELPLDLEYKQELLETRGEAQRQSSLLERLEKWLPQLTYLDRLRRRAGGNGHGLR